MLLPVLISTPKTLRVALFNSFKYYKNMTNQVISPIDTKSRVDVKIQSGDSVKVWQKIKEKNKIRLQVFEGIVIAKKHGNEAGSTFTVRRVGTDGIGIEKTFPLFSPMIDKIEVIKRSKTKRAKLYYLRKKTARKIKEKLRRVFSMGISTVSELEEEKKKIEQEKLQKQKEEKDKKQQEDREKKEEQERKKQDENENKVDTEQEQPETKE